MTLHVRVDKKTAGPLTSGQDQLYDILVLHLVGGKDIFITVSGEYQRSSFGASIDALVRMTVPICELTTASILQLEGMYYSAGYIREWNGYLLIFLDPEKLETF